MASSRGASAQNELLDKFGYKPKTMSRTDRARMRNMKRGAASEESSDAEMRDDKIAEDYGEESGSEIEDDKKNLEESSECETRRRPSRAGRRRLVN